MKSPLKNMKISKQKSRNKKIEPKAMALLIAGVFVLSQIYQNFSNLMFNLLEIWNSSSDNEVNYGSKNQLKFIQTF